MKRKNIMNKQQIIDFEQLWISHVKCRREVRWKPSVKSFELNGPQNVYKMWQKLNAGTWKNGNPKPITIPYPKKREGLSVSFKDRVYQRSINDNTLYPVMTNSFIYDNAACQKGKGTDFARKRIKKFMRRFYAEHKRDGYVLQIDIHGYYPSLRHDLVNKMYRDKLDTEVADMVIGVLDHQYKGDIGYNPGSQMVQITGISFLNQLDHLIKEKFHIKYYIRYMDDFWILHEDENYLKECMEKILGWLGDHGLSPNEKKTHIKPLSKGFMFLGFKYHMTETGKVIMTIDPQNVKHERKKLYRMVQKAKKGDLTKQKVDQCYASWRAHASLGNSHKLIERMDKYYKDLWRDDNETQTQRNTDPAGKRAGSPQGQNCGSSGSD